MKILVGLRVHSLARFAAVSLAGADEPIADTVEYQYMPVFNASI